MEINNMSSYFDSKILRRGYDYYNSGQVSNVVIKGNQVKGIVSGTYEYEVLINLKGDKYIMECTCPYAQEDYCKHMAALLYYLKEGNIIRKTNKIDKSSILQEKNLEYYTRKFDSDLEYLYSQNEYFDYGGDYLFVDLINNYCALMQEQYARDKELVFDMICFLYKAVDNVHMDGSNGEYILGINEINGLVESLLPDQEFFDKFVMFTKRILVNNELREFNTFPLDAICNYAHDLKSAKMVNNIIDEIYEQYLNNELEISDDIFWGTYLLKKIQNQYNYVDKQKAIEEAFENIDDICV